MQDEIGETMGTQIGLRKLNEVVHHIRPAVEMTLSSVPPVIMLDAIWMTLLEPTGATQTDRAGRQRPTKGKEKVCLLVGWGSLSPGNGCSCRAKHAVCIVNGALNCSFTMVVRV